MIFSYKLANLMNCFIKVINYHASFIFKLKLKSADFKLIYSLKNSITNNEKNILSFVYHFFGLLAKNELSIESIAESQK
jgi:hypothetical protein